MKILALNTAFDFCSVGFIDTNHRNSMFIVEKKQAKSHSQFVLELVDEVLIEVDCKLSDLDAMAYLTGAGSFTGLRIQESIAEALKFTENLQLIKISSLQALAQTAYRMLNRRHFFISVDAKGGKFHFAEYHVEDQRAQLAGTAQYLSATDQILPPILKTSEFYGVGDGFLTYGKILKEKLGHFYPNNVETGLRPEMQDILLLAYKAIGASEK